MRGRERARGRERGKWREIRTGEGWQPFEKFVSSAERFFEREGAPAHSRRSSLARVSLNPALDEARFCPRCAAEAEVRHPRSIVCPACGYQAYYNPKPVAAAIPYDADGNIWLLRRGPGLGEGLWTFPGGFVDLGESVPDAVRREAMEEMDIELDLGDLVGVYSRPEDRVVLVVYRAMLRPGTTPATSEEAVEVRAFAPAELPWGELAFWSTELALRDATGGEPG